MSYAPAISQAPRVALGGLRVGKHAWLWDGTEIQVLRQSPGSTLVLYLESKARVTISHRTQVWVAKPKGA